MNKQITLQEAKEFADVLGEVDLALSELCGKYMQDYATVHWVTFCHLKDSLAALIMHTGRTGQEYDAALRQYFPGRLDDYDPMYIEKQSKMP